jgi:hypothetical protein
MPGCSHSLDCELVASAAEKAVRWLAGERLGKGARVGCDRIVLTFWDVKSEPALRRMNLMFAQVRSYCMRDMTIRTLLRAIGNASVPS